VHPLAGKKQQAWRDFAKTTLPILMTGNILHDLLTVFIFETPPSAHFVYPV
jgi:hypothetical protein